MASHRKAKGTVAVNEKFWIVVIIIMFVVMLAIWLLLNQYFAGYVTQNIQSKAKICEQFEYVPVIGTIGGCKPDT